MGTFTFRLDFNNFFIGTGLLHHPTFIVVLKFKSVRKTLDLILSIDLLSCFHIAGSIEASVEIGINAGIEYHASRSGQISPHIEEEKYQ